ncbi:carbonic anhydrase family protein [Chryseobacterium sp. JUb7]|uniref:carbonic anhydrase family protein n=1 Tax=Chryseobacterium sp. JUb7 TaxID=2940599 RepID=UPI0021676F12|nr:carbonic anhydrase family protein [Chryseobacterium sp. JUb7]MCS3531020.1 carbonic anhydrase [Chryseobacterium sp. JUb7]
MKQTSILALYKTTARTSNLLLSTLSFFLLFLLASCHNDEDVNYDLTAYPSDLVSTPIYTSNFPLAVAEAQSPINIEPSKAIVFHSVDPVLHYGAITLNSVANNAGENLRVNVSGSDSSNNYITVGGKKYYLVNFHFHYSSEHTVDGKYSKMEIHFVNVSSDNSYAVLSVMVEPGNVNTSLQNLFSQSPVMANAINSPNTTFDLTALFPSNTRSYYTYNGSLTTPNFGAASAVTNGGPVTWFVFKDKQQISDTEFNSYTGIYTEPNFRAIQPLKGRKVYVNPGF